LQDIISSLRETISKGKRGDAKLLTTISILKDYLDCWDELFDHLDKFYGGADTANPARDKFERLRSAGKLFQVDASNLLDALVNENGNINFDVNEAEYTRSLEGFKDEFARLPQHPQNPTEKLSSIVSEAARSGAAKAHRSLRCAAARIAHEAIMKERDGEYDEAGFSAITHKRSKKRGRRKKLDGMPIIKVLLGKWDQEGSAYPTDYKFCQRYYYDTAFWKKQKWISDKGTRICFAPAKDDIGSRKAFLRFMMKFRRELALREKPTP